MQKIYLVARFATDANQRNLQLLSLGNEQRQVFLACQLKGSRFSSAQCINIRQDFRVTSILSHLGVGHNLRVRIESKLYGPTTQVLFIKPAIRRLAKLIAQDLKSGTSVVVVNLTPPHELVLIGHALKQQFPEIKWFIDWQDLWSADDYYFRGTDALKRWALRTEKQAVDLCDLNIVTNNRAKSYFEARFQPARGKVRAIPHAYALSELKPQSTVQRLSLPEDRPLKMAFLGNLLKPPKVPGEVLLNALQEVSEHGHRFEFHVLGDKLLEKQGQAFTERYKWLIPHARKSHVQSVQCLQEYDLLVLLLGDLDVAKLILHAKLPSYLASGKPILAIVPMESACKDTLTACGGACVIESRTDWGEELKLFFLRLKKDGFTFTFNARATAAFSWPQVCNLWTRMLETTKEKPSTD